MGLCDWSIATVNRCPSFTDAGVCPMGPQKGPPGIGIPLPLHGGGGRPRPGELHMLKFIITGVSDPGCRFHMGSSAWVGWVVRGEIAAYVNRRTELGPPWRQ